MAYTQGRREGNQLDKCILECEKYLKAYFLSVTVAVHTSNKVPTHKKYFKLHTHRGYWHIKNPPKLFPLSCCWLATT